MVKWLKKKLGILALEERVKALEERLEGSGEGSGETAINGDENVTQEQIFNEFFYGKNGDFK